MDVSKLPSQLKARLDTVAELMLEIYETLAEMRYLEPVGIIRGPHKISQELQTLYTEKNLDPAIIYLYSVLPYIDKEEANASDFFHGGEFSDFRKARDVERGRDPMYLSPKGGFDDEEGQYMRPWYTPLSNMGNHQSVALYDAREHRIWIIDQEGWNTTDYALLGFPRGEESKNRNNSDHLPSRPADQVLCDIDHWYRILKELPGGGEHSHGEWSHHGTNLKQLYINNGWPNNFNGDAFEIAQAREYCVTRAKYNAEEPLRKVECFKGWSKYSNLDIQRYTKTIAGAKNLDEERKAKYELRKAEERSERNARDLKEAQEKAEKMCPGGKCQMNEDLSLWEYEQTRHEHKWKLERLRTMQTWAEDAKNNPEPEQLRYPQIRVRHAERAATLYKKALEACTADAERLCPGRTFQQATGIKTLGRQDVLTKIENSKAFIVATEKRTEELREWAAKVPSEATQVKEMVDRDVKENENCVEGMKNDLKRSEDWLAEHGNTD